MEEHSTDEQDLITLSLDRSGKLVPTASQVCDYQKRGDPLQDVNVWDFVAQTQKIKPPSAKHSKKPSVAKPDTSDHDSDSDDDNFQDDNEPAGQQPNRPTVESDPPAAEPKKQLWDCHNILDFEGTIRDCLLGHLSIYRRGPMHIVQLIQAYRVSIEGIHPTSELTFFCGFT
jgi:hypothetical protein